MTSRSRRQAGHTARGRHRAPRHHRQHLGNVALQVEDLAVLAHQHVLADLKLPLGLAERGEEIHLDLGLGAEVVLQLLLLSLRRAQRRHQLLRIAATLVLAQMVDLLLSFLPPRLRPHQLVPQRLDLHLQLVHGGRVRGLLLLSQVHLGLRLLLALPLRLELELEVGPLLLLLSELLLQAGQGLLLPGASRDQIVDPRLQSRFLHKQR